MCLNLTLNSSGDCCLLGTSVADPYPDSSHPYVFGPPGSGSISRSTLWILIRILQSPSKNSKKKHESYCFVTFFWIFIFEKWCNCTLSRKTFFISFLLASWRSMTIKLSRIRIICQRHGSGSAPKCHGSATLLGTAPLMKILKFLVFLLHPFYQIEH